MRFIFRKQGIAIAKMRIVEPQHFLHPLATHVQPFEMRQQPFAPSRIREEIRPRLFALEQRRRSGTPSLPTTLRTIRRHIHDGPKTW